MPTTELAEIFVGQQTSQDTRRAYAADIKKWQTFLDGRQETQRIVLEFKQYLETTLHPSSASRTFGTIRTFYRFAGGDNPFQNIKSPKRIGNATPKIPSETQVKSLLDTCDDLRDRAIIALLMNGLRAAEAASLRRTDWSYEEDYGAYVLRVTGKGQKARLVPATTETERAVTAWLEEAEPSDWLTPTRRGRRMTYRQIEYVVAKWSKLSGKEFYPHVLRHYYAQRLIRRGANVIALSQLLGHSNVSTTQIYSNLELGDLVKANARFDGELI